MGCKIQWAGNGWEQAVAIAVDASGNAYVTGSSYGGSATSTDYVTIKYDTDGNQLWIARYNRRWEMAAIMLLP